MERSKWTFTYSADALIEAAKTQRDDRLMRRGRWEKQRNNVMEDIKKDGITVNEPQSKTLSNDRSALYGRGSRIMIRADLQEKLEECEDRIRLHDNAAREYDGWIQALTANGMEKFPLAIDDWLYFFGHTERLEDENAKQKFQEASG